jgi:uroporphyrinogen-III decarboxylase
MTPGDRLYQAIDGRMPDRVPAVPKIWVDLAARLTGTDLIEVIADPFTALRVISQAGRMCRADAVRQFHFPRRRVQQSDGRVWEVDSHGQRIGEIDMQGGLATRLSEPFDVSLEDAAFVAYHHFRSSDAPIVKGVADARKLAVPDKSFYEQDGCGDRQRRILEELDGEVAVIGDCGSATLAFYVELRGLSQAMFDLIEEPSLVQRVMEKGVAIAVEKGKFNLDLGLRVLRLNDSVGNMTVISPRHWREFVFPHMKAVCDELHSYRPDARVYCHICGNILPIAEDLVEAGLDCIGPLDPLGGFTPADIRRRVGDRVSLMGGVNTLSFIRGGRAQILGEAQSCIRQAGEHGGYILGSGCIIPRDASRENLLALREAADMYGIYRDNGLIGRGELEPD